MRSRFVTRFRTIAGAEFLGEINDAPGQTEVGLFTYPRRILKVSPNSHVQVGTVFVTATGRRYLCADNGIGLRGDLLFRSFKLLEVDRLLTVKRRVETADPLTGLTKSGALTTVATVDGVLEPLTQQSDQLNVPYDRYRILTGFDLQKDDLVDDRYRVVRVDHLLGVYVAEAQ